MTILTQTSARRALIASVFALVVAGVVAPFALSLADDGEDAPQASAVLGTAFTYQGRLQIDRLPADGIYDLGFQLYDDATPDITDVQIGPRREVLDVMVTNGLFSVAINFGTGVFDGNARWLEVGVSEPGQGAFTVFEARQLLSATPYSVYSITTGPHDHFGQNWTGSTVADSGLNIYNSGTGIAISGQSGSGSGYLGYRGHIGVLGGLNGICGNVTLATISAGVHGATCINDSASDGVRGYSFKGSGVKGEGPTIGVQGDATVGNGIGVYGIAGDYPPTLPMLTGVHGYSNGGVGVYGRSAGDGSVGVKGLADGANSLAGQFIGHITVSSCTGCTNPSDQRLKRDIAPAIRGLAEILSLQPVSFAYNEEIYGPGTHLGFLAQDVREVLPELVSEMESGYLRVDYDGVIPVLTKAIQEQQAQIESLRTGSPVSVASAAPAGTVAVGELAIAGAIAFFALGLFAVAGAIGASDRDE